MTSETIEKIIGRRLKELRKIRGITLDTLATKTGFTKGYLSKIENAKKLPPIETLAKISTALNTEIAYFFQQDDELQSTDDEYSIVRAQERKRVVLGGSSFGYDYESIAYKKTKKSIEPFIFTFPENFKNDEYFSHEGEEMLFILSGTVEFDIEGKVVILSPGDCVYMNSIIRHRGKAIDGEAKALVAIYQPEAE